MKKKNRPTVNVQKEEKAATLKDLLDPATLYRLTSTEKELRKQEEAKKEEERQKKIAEQKKREKNKSFTELLNESKLDWRQYK